jgi:hypothetical protein
MLSPSARAQIKAEAEVERLELAHEDGNDEGIRKVIEGRIKEQKEN